MKHPVTILIPAFCRTNTSVDWLVDSIECALDTNAHVVVWDDGSHIDIGRIRNRFKKHTIWSGNDSNHGPSYARNRAAELAETDLILPLDCDDKIRADAVELLWNHWQEKPGIPVFPDIWKFGDVNDPHYKLLSWSCALQRKKLGIASVNVLHSKEQWKLIGGWDESFTSYDLYEDAEYNARLFITYCARNMHIPLIGYRQHKDSRTTVRKLEAAALARQMLRRIGGYYNMAGGCCGKKRKSPSNAPAPRASSASNKSGTLLNNPNNLPGTQGDRVLVQYINGKGKLRHYRRGPVTKFPYRVQHGQYMYVDEADSRTPNEPASKSPFVRVPDDSEKVVEDQKRTKRERPGKKRPR